MTVRRLLLVVAAACAVLPACGSEAPEPTAARAGSTAVAGEPALTFRPVIDPIDLCPEEPAPPTAPVPQETRRGEPITTTQPEPPGPSPSTEALPPGVDILPRAEDEHCFRLGPVGLDGTALASAEAVLGPQGAWGVEVTVVADQRARANALFDACYEALDTCPPNGAVGHGLLAIVLDGEVISAPEVNSAGLADGPFTIPGGGMDGFTRAEAVDLATRLTG